MAKKVLNVAVIGCGGISRRHIEGVLEKKEANLYAVCDPNEGRMKKKQETYNVPVGVTDYRELVNDTTIAIYKFPNDVLGKVFCSIGVKRDYTMRTCLYGTKGTIIMDEGKTGITLYQCDADGKGYTVPQPIACEYISHNMKAEVASFIDALINDTPMLIDPMEGASTVAVCCATVAAAKSGETVKIRYPQI